MNITFDDRDKEFHHLKLRKMSMDELVAKFTHLLCYVLYLKEEKIKV